MTLCLVDDVMRNDDGDITLFTLHHFIRLLILELSGVFNSPCDTQKHQGFIEHLELCHHLRQNSNSLHYNWEGSCTFLGYSSKSEVRKMDKKVRILHTDQLLVCIETDEFPNLRYCGAALSNFPRPSRSCWAYFLP